MFSKLSTLANLIRKLLRPFKGFRIVFAIRGYVKFFGDLYAYKKTSGNEKIRVADFTPMLFDNTTGQNIDKHYFHQGIWAFEKINNKRPANHVDVGGQTDLVGFLTAITKVTYVDIRPLQVVLENFNNLKGSILEMPFKDGAISSLSCLHVAEHIGLGRYGDPIDPQGTIKACVELTRVLAKDGDLYFSIPVGIQKTCFNAHRIHSPETVLNYFHSLELVEFSGITDQGKFLRNSRPDEFNIFQYAAGFFHFRKP